jgi:hypothetical protein
MIVCPGERCDTRIDPDALPGAMCRKCFSQLNHDTRRVLEAQHRRRHGETRHTVKGA